MSSQDTSKQVPSKLFVEITEISKHEMNLILPYANIKVDYTPRSSSALVTNISSIDEQFNAIWVNIAEEPDIAHLKVFFQLYSNPYQGVQAPTHSFTLSLNTVNKNEFKAEFRAKFNEQFDTFAKDKIIIIKEKQKNFISDKHLQGIINTLAATAEDAVKKKYPKAKITITPAYSIKKVQINVVPVNIGYTIGGINIIISISEAKKKIIMLFTFVSGKEHTKLTQSTVDLAFSNTIEDTLQEFNVIFNAALHSFTKPYN